MNRLSVRLGAFSILFSIAACGGDTMCPALDCDDGDPCTSDQVQGTGCNATCTHAPLTNCSQILCGDGTLQQGELCDPGIATGPGACPIDCDDSDACTEDQIIGADCRVQCKNEAITTYVGGDACCPPGADATNDPDCASSCGNGVLERGELCDTAISGSCPSTADCNDDLACTRDEVEQQGGDACRAICSNVEITNAGPTDGCCPTGAGPGTDPDCAGCGDGSVGGNETCDTAITTGPNACPTMADCIDTDPCTIDDLVGEGTCSAACSHTPNTTLTSGDGCCQMVGTFPSIDADCPQLGNGWSCNTAFDCTSNRCEFFEVGAVSMCTTGCTPTTLDHEGGCPAGADGSWDRVCLSAAEASNGGAQNVCAYFVPGTVGFEELEPNATLQWSFTDPSQIHVWMLPIYADGVARNWQITIAPNAGLDVAARRFDQALLPIGTICNGAGTGGAETCPVGISASEASERFWFAVAPNAGLGDYQITLTLQ